MKKFFHEFKEFAMRGSVLDMAIGIIIGGAFTPIVNSFVNDVLMPPLGVLIGNVDFSQLAFTLRKATVEHPAAVVIRYGAFINTVITFVIIAFAIFLMLKVINLTRRKHEEKAAAAPVPTKEEELLTQIRDILREEKKK
jgi:large conductance mechanosensitive channel